MKKYNKKDLPLPLDIDSQYMHHKNGFIFKDKICIKESSFYHGEELLTTPQKENCSIILDNDQNIHIGYEYHHILSNKKSVLFAGEIKILNGKVININFCSGHYEPSRKRFKWFLNFLKYNTVLIEDSTIQNGWK